MGNQNLLQTFNISKEFPGVKALQDINLSFKTGRVHAVVGENGAGKSTLMNIISGVLKPDNGKILWYGKKIDIKNPLYAQELGIAMIYQENSLIPHLSVMENIFLNRFDKKRSGFIDFIKMKNKAEELLSKLEISHINPETSAIKLSAAEKQLVEIVRAISLNPKLMIFDEPTAALSKTEVKMLMEIIDSLRQKGMGIIYISHRMGEIFNIADDITILRDGQHIITSPKEELNIDKVITLMVGRKLNKEIEKTKKEFFELQDEKQTKVVFSVKGLRKKDLLYDINFNLYKGEVLGFAGLVGAGRSELMETIFGFRKKDDGEIFIGNKKLKIKNSHDAIKNGIGMVPEERKLKGLFLSLSVKENINITNLPNLKEVMFLNRSKENKAANSFIEKLQIRTPSLNQSIGNLSGGNQQKAIIARWLSIKPGILIMDEPTHGIDVGTKAEIYKIIRNLTDKGVSILLVSSEMPELLRLSDRIAVMHKGKIEKVLQRSEVTQELIMKHATD